MTFDLTTCMQVLERTPRTLHAMLDGLAPGWLDGTEGPDTWSCREAVGPWRAYLRVMDRS